MANSCYTADAAWCLMYEQKLDIHLKLEATKAKSLRRKAKRLQIEADLKSENEVVRLTAEADLLEFESSEGLIEMAIEGAKMELATIEAIMKELEPQRKYGHLPVLEASQAAQREEWLGEFKARTENYLLSSGTIPEDQLNAMRKHPDFESQIVPHVQQVVEKIAAAKDKIGLLKNKTTLLLETNNGC